MVAFFHVVTMGISEERRTFDQILTNEVLRSNEQHVNYIKIINRSEKREINKLEKELYLITGTRRQIYNRIGR